MAIMMEVTKVPGPYRHVGELIEERRQALKLSQEALADLLAEKTGKKVGQNWVTRLESYSKPGKLPTPFERVAPLCQILGITQAELLAAAGYDIDPGSTDPEDISEVMWEAQWRESLIHLVDSPEDAQAFDRIFTALRSKRVKTNHARQ